MLFSGIGMLFALSDVGIPPGEFVGGLLDRVEDVEVVEQSLPLVVVHVTLMLWMVWCCWAFALALLLISLGVVRAWLVLFGLLCCGGKWL